MRVLDKNKKEVQPRKKESGRLTWTLPPIGFAKCNVDGAVARHGGGRAVAGICRDHNDLYLRLSSITFIDNTDFPNLEALAWREAQALADDLNRSSSHQIVQLPSRILRIKLENNMQR